MLRDDYSRSLAAAFALAIAGLVALCLLAPDSWVAWWSTPYVDRSAGEADRERGPLQLLPPELSPELASELPAEVIPTAADSSGGPAAVAPVTLGPAAAVWRAAWAEYRAAGAPPWPTPGRLDEDSLRALTRRRLAARPADLLRAPADSSRAARLAFLRAFYGEDLLRRLPQLESAIHERRAAEVIEREIDLFGERTLRR
ncbi:MAG: hypothetical protein ACYDIE_09705 [Candidatus Krumholzibacteriia bacterium]